MSSTGQATARVLNPAMTSTRRRMTEDPMGVTESTARRGLPELDQEVLGYRLTGTPRGTPRLRIRCTLSNPECPDDPRLQTTRFGRRAPPQDENPSLPCNSPTHSTVPPCTDQEVAQQDLTSCTKGPPR